MDVGQTTKAIQECLGSLGWLVKGEGSFSSPLVSVVIRSKLFLSSKADELAAVGVQHVDSSNVSHVIAALHPDRFTRLKAAKLARKLDINLTDVCNLKCDYCYQRSRDLDWQDAQKQSVSSNLSTERIVELLDEASALGATRLKFTGGEPFARQDIFKLLEHAASLDFEFVEVCTNLRLLHGKRMEQTVEVFENSPTHIHFHVSIDGYTEDPAHILRKSEKLFLPSDFAILEELKRRIPNFSFSVNTMWVNTFVEDGVPPLIFEKLVLLNPTRWSISLPYLVRDSIAPIREGSDIYPDFDKIIHVSKDLLAMRRSKSPNFPLSIPLVFKYEGEDENAGISVTESTEAASLFNHPCFPCHGSFFIVGPRGQNFDCLLLSETTASLKNSSIISRITETEENPWLSMTVDMVSPDCQGCRYQNICGGQCPNDRWNSSGGEKFGRDKAACSLLQRAEHEIWEQKEYSSHYMTAAVKDDGFFPSSYSSLSEVVSGGKPDLPDRADYLSDNGIDYESSPAEISFMIR